MRKKGWPDVMPSTLAASAVQPHLTNLDVPRRPAKVHTVSHKKSAMDAQRRQLATWITVALEISRLTRDQFSDAIGCHPTQLSKWIGNQEPPQIDRVLCSPMRGFLLQAIAEETPGFSVRVVIERTA